MSTEAKDVSEPNDQGVGDQPLVTDRRSWVVAVTDTGGGNSRVESIAHWNAGAEIIRVAELQDDDPNIYTLVSKVVEVMDMLAFVRDKIIQGEPLNVAHFLSECEHGLRDAMRSSQ